VGRQQRIKKETAMKAWHFPPGLVFRHRHLVLKSVFERVIKRRVNGFGVGLERAAVEA